MYKRVVTKLNECVCSGAGYLLTLENPGYWVKFQIKPNLDGVSINTEQSLSETVRMRRQDQFQTSWWLTAGFLSTQCSRICSFMRSQLMLVLPSDRITRDPEITSEGRRLLRVRESSGRLILRGLT